MLHRLKLLGKLSTWFVILLANDIKYVPRNAMKAQALAYAEMTLPFETIEPTMKEWQVWGDGDCRVGGSGISILLQSQAWIKLWYTIKLVFNAMNNAAEDEAVIMMLRIIKEVGVQKSVIFRWCTVSCQSNDRITSRFPTRAWQSMKKRSR